MSKRKDKIEREARKSRFHTVCYVTPEKTFVRTESTEGRKESSARIRNYENLKDNRTEGDMSLKASKNVRLSLDWMVSQASFRWTFDKDGRRTQKMRLAFITLTLPSKQMHSDNFIKENCLNQFLVELRRDHGLKNYLWRAEAQFNGNIHFHICIDQFIYHDIIRKRWMRIIDKYGYVQRYIENRRLKIDCNHYDVISEFEKKHGYTKESGYTQDFEKRYGFKEPPCTEIKAIRHVKKIQAYFSAEFTKNKNLDVPYTIMKGNYEKVCTFYEKKELLKKAQWGFTEELSLTEMIEKGINKFDYVSEYDDVYEPIELPSDSNWNASFINERLFNDMDGTKPMTLGQIRDIVKNNNVQLMKGVKSNNLVFKRRAIEGRLWFCGGSIAKAKSIKFELCDEAGETSEFYRILKREKVRTMDCYSKLKEGQEKRCVGLLLFCSMYKIAEMIGGNSLNRINSYIELIHQDKLPSRKKRLEVDEPDIGDPPDDDLNETIFNTVDKPIEQLTISELLLF